MNFKRYHVSRNLFDKDNATLYTLYAGNGDIIRVSSNARSIAISCIEGETYTVSKKAGQRFMICFTTEPIAAQVPYSGLVTDNTATSITARAPEGAKYLFVYFYNSTADTDTVEALVNSIMINTGSTALPYEPYSSEVWHDTPHYIHNTSTDTITSLPAVIYPNAATATVGLKGQAVQSTTPTPDNPIIPQGTGERTGNLWDNSSTISKGQEPSYYTANFGTPLPAGTYTFSAKVIGEEGVTACRVSFRKSNMGQIAAGYIAVSSERTSFTIVLKEPCYGVYLYGGNDTVKLAAVTYQDIMLNSGSTTLPYEPYGYKIPISSANTTTPVYLGEVQTTRKIRKLVLTGLEGKWRLNNRIASVGGQYFNLSIATQERTDFGRMLCSHYAVANPYDRLSACCVIANYSQGIDVRINNPSTDGNIDTFKAYLAAQYAAGTPVTIWYVLATPTTGIVNEPLMKIGNYADEVSGISIPVTAGGDTLSVDTTVQPSEVTVNCKGWHPAIVHERTNGAWT